MNKNTQSKLYDRIQAHRNDRHGTDEADSSMRIPVTDYTSLAQHESDCALLNATSTVVGLSGLVPEKGSYATVTIGDSPIVITRKDDGSVGAFLNVCRHRGAPVASGCGHAKRLVCPYHGWSYSLNGDLAARRRGEYFDDIKEEGLVALPVREEHGLIWVSPDADGVIDNAPLHGAEAELEPFDLASYRLFDSQEMIKPFNWKLGVETFCETYHLRSLHAETLDSFVHSDYSLFDKFGPHGRMVVTRRSIDELEEGGGSSAENFDLIPHTTLLWFLVPNTVLLFQQDHVELFSSRPGAHPGETVLSVSLYVPKDSSQPDSHWQTNYKILMDVTEKEDFAIAASIQRGFLSGAQKELTFGRNEPGLQHYHRSVVKARLG